MIVVLWLEEQWQALSLEREADELRDKPGHCLRSWAVSLCLLECSQLCVCGTSKSDDADNENWKGWTSGWEGNGKGCDTTKGRRQQEARQQRQEEKDSKKTYEKGGNKKGGRSVGAGTGCSPSAGRASSPGPEGEGFNYRWPAFSSGKRIRYRKHGVRA
jgi:hypothetical protein